MKRLLNENADWRAWCERRCLDGIVHHLDKMHEEMLKMELLYKKLNITHQGFDGVYADISDYLRKTGVQDWQVRGG